jgi:transposase
MGLRFCERAANLNIATSSTAFQKFEISGEIGIPEARKSRQELRSLDEHSELTVIALIPQTPTLYLHEICPTIQEVTSISVSQATICRLLKRYGFSRKKVKQVHVALQRCHELRGAFMAQSSLFSRDQLVWVDETGSDAKDSVRKFGYAIRGCTPVTHRLLVRGRRVNAIAALTSNGIVAVDTVTGSVSGHTFFDFLRGTLIPQLMSFNGTNPNSVLIATCNHNHSCV